MAKLPLLMFPKAKTIPRPKGNGFAPGKPHLPSHTVQVGRLMAVTVKIDMQEQEKLV